MLMDRELAKRLGRETLQILAAGAYSTEDGLVADINELVRQAVKGTVSYPPGCNLARPSPVCEQTTFDVVNDTTLTVARMLTDQGLQPVALNFAAATHPGGGFLTGARAQEESLARSSALYACLDGHEMYDVHRQQADALYTDYTIYSPGVPVFRNDDGSLLPSPYLCSFVTCAAVNASALRKYAPHRTSEILPAMRQRIIKVLTVASLHRHETLILGAWGCGAFGNDSREIAALFRQVFAEDFQGNFRSVIFAVTDWSEERKFIGPFCQAFGVSLI